MKTLGAGLAVLNAACSKASPSGKATRKKPVRQIPQVTVATWGRGNRFSLGRASSVKLVGNQQPFSSHSDERAQRSRRRGSGETMTSAKLSVSHRNQPERSLNMHEVSIPCPKVTTVKRCTTTIASAKDATVHRVTKSNLPTSERRRPRSLIVSFHCKT